MIKENVHKAKRLKEDSDRIEQYLKEPHIDYIRIADGDRNSRNITDVISEEAHQTITRIVKVLVVEEMKILNEKILAELNEL